MERILSGSFFASYNYYYSIRSYQTSVFKNNLPSLSNIPAIDPNRLLKLGIWAYFLLVIFEGALRKWFLPGLSTPLLIIRDPIAIWLVVKVWQKGMLPLNIYLGGIVAIGVAGVFTATLLGHGSLPVALFGARILLFHYPLMFVIGRVFNREDVIKMGVVIFWISIPMTILIALQFYSPQSAWVNRGVGGDIEGSGFSGALGFFRPSGTFSFTNGITNFYSMVSCYIFYFWFNHTDINRFLLLGATVSLLVAIPISISRTLLFQTCIAFLFVLFATSRNPKFLGRLLLAAIGGILVLVFLSGTSFFQTATEVFTARLESASESEGGIVGSLVDRFLGDLIISIVLASEQPFFGYGLGMGTNAGSKLLVGKVSYLIAEGEWGRQIGELGPLMGLTVIFLRIGLVVKIAWACYGKLIKGDLLPWLLLSFGIMAVAVGQWAQPTTLGFCTLTGGLLLASLRTQ